MVTTLKGRYEIQRVFADSGGMGVIYEALDRKCRDNLVLIKTTRYDGGAAAKHFRYTQDEALKHIEKQRKIISWEKKILVRFKNEQVGNIPSPNDFFLDQSLLLSKDYQGKFGPFSLPEQVLAGEPYLVMERIEGQPLNKAAGQGWFRERLEERLLIIAKELLTIFIKFHRPVKIGPGEGVFIYQDLKPANVLISEGDYVTLIDLGAVTLRIGGKTTEPTAGCITAGYAAPEAAGGRESTIDPRFDLYTLGVTLWEVATQQDPQELGGEFPEIPLKPLKDTPLSPATKRIIARALEPNPATRFQSAAEMRREVVSALDAARARRGAGA